MFDWVNQWLHERIHDWIRELPNEWNKKITCFSFLTVFITCQPSVWSRHQLVLARFFLIPIVIPVSVSPVEKMLDIWQKWDLYSPPFCFFVSPVSLHSINPVSFGACFLGSVVNESHNSLFCKIILASRSLWAKEHQLIYSGQVVLETSALALH